MYKQLYQLKRDPFSKDLPTGDAYQSTDFIQCSARLDYLAQTRGLALIVAAPGFGKSFTLKAFAEKQNVNITKVIYICLSTVSTMEFYRQLTVALGLEPRFHKTDMFRAIQECIDYLHVNKRIHLVVIIDEAQYLNTEILRELKLLMNFNYDSASRFSVVLAGQPSLADTLSRQVYESVRQRIAVNYTFSGITLTEAEEYAAKMLADAGGSSTLFDSASILAAFNSSNGSIRVFGQILQTALSIGAQNNAMSIDTEMIMAAVSEIAIK